MHHRMSYFNSRWKTVEQQPSDLAFKNCDQIRVLFQVLFSAMDRRRQMPFERPGNCQSLFTVGVMDEESRRPENLVVKIRFKKRCRVGFKQRRVRCESRSRA